MLRFNQLLVSSSFLSFCVALEVLVVYILHDLHLPYSWALHVQVGLKSPGDIQRNESHLYCHVTTPIPCVLVRIIFVLLQNYRGSRNLVACVLSIVMSLATMIAEGSSSTHCSVVHWLWNVVVIVIVIRKNMVELERGPSSLPTHFLTRLFSLSACICLAVWWAFA